MGVGCPGGVSIWPHAILSTNIKARGEVAVGALGGEPSQRHALAQEENWVVAFFLSISSTMASHPPRRVGKTSRKED